MDQHLKVTFVTNMDVTVNVAKMSGNLKTMKGGMDSFKDQKDELESSLDEIKSSYGDQLKNIAVSVEAQAKGM